MFAAGEWHEADSLSGDSDASARMRRVLPPRGRPRQLCSLLAALCCCNTARAGALYRELFTSSGESERSAGAGAKRDSGHYYASHGGYGSTYETM